MAATNPDVNSVSSLAKTSVEKTMNSSASVVTVLDRRFIKNVQSVLPKKRQDVFKWYGWGYNDSEFYVENDVVHFRGSKYPLNGTSLPYFTEWVIKTFHVDISKTNPLPEIPQRLPAPIRNTMFLEDLRQTNISYSEEPLDRLVRCHGQTLDDIYSVWYNRFERIPDLVVWPVNHDDVQQLVDLANRHNVVLLPFGGGTSVSGAVTCPQKESRTICALDTTQMNRLLWLNKRNLTVCFEAGIIGQDLERVLAKEGLTLGHEPDSYEFSTLGGWVATRASGMKKNVYGNIEDLLVSVRMVTANGSLQRDCNAPRVSCGPDFNQIILGSEGTLGVITEVVLKVRPVPPIKRYGSLIFPDFESGVMFMREVARRRCQPASVRLMDNEQFVMGQSLKTAKGWTDHTIDFFKKFYLTRCKGLQLSKICAATLLFEGEVNDVDRQETLIYEIAKRFKGISAGSQNGERGYILTFVIAYIRDIGLRYNVVAESFETSMPWDCCYRLCRNVRQRVTLECRNRHIEHFIITCRVTQTYDAGACVYFYFGFKYDGNSDPVRLFEAIETCAREEILTSGGSLSHHHGVGKIRSRWYERTVTPIGLGVYKAIKDQLDPRNIFASQNLLPSNEDSHSKQITKTPVKAKL